MHKNILSLNMMRELSIDDIVKLYQQGYRLEDKIEHLQVICPTGCRPQSDLDRAWALVGVLTVVLISTVLWIYLPKK